MTFPKDLTKGDVFRSGDKAWLWDGKGWQVLPDDDELSEEIEQMKAQHEKET